MVFTEERALFGLDHLHITDCVFEKGESPLKEAKDISMDRCLFRYKYPLWYTSNVHVRQATWFEDARAGVWYVDDIGVEKCLIKAPKNFRRVKNLYMEEVTFTNAKETLWSCDDVTLKDVRVKGDYFGMNCTSIKADSLVLDGNYSFDGVRDLNITNSHLISKDAFWNCENVVVENSFITGEYLGWNSKNVNLINCVIESLQGMCYIDNLVMKNCHLINTTLAFEYSHVDAEIDNRIESVLNPVSGEIRAKEIGTLIIQKDRIDPGLTHIKCDSIENKTDIVDWSMVM